MGRGDKMKLHDLIDKLKEAKKVHGDIEVRFYLKRQGYDYETQTVDHYRDGNCIHINDLTPSRNYDY